jgi:hypothetical protein
MANATTFLPAWGATAAGSLEPPHPPANSRAMKRTLKKTGALFLILEAPPYTRINHCMREIL